MELLIHLMGVVPFWPEIHYRIVEQTRDMADTLMYSISAAIQRSINESEWMDAKSKDIALTQLTKIKVVLGTSREAETERILTMLYADVPAVTSQRLELLAPVLVVAVNVEHTDSVLTLIAPLCVKQHLHLYMTDLAAHEFQVVGEELPSSQRGTLQRLVS
ncbi:hypothetical protein HPB52_021639 [Rhipicephalus sanguineus]|uniref:Uncharacterized protein n=1 Tax=Rhipicephalus sanguineus TaxID=34632 RepID=A0A9D4Q2T4_RHISA|nr:hypothetical protein HPB52_021639 [Rhipicephalus sanguineus]